jgi:hypothetical protein
VPDGLSVVVISSCAVILSETHTAFFEICFPNHMGKDHFGPTSQGVPYPHAQRGKPRFTLVSDGKTLRRLLLVS